jgi:hypothetical protein
MFKFMKTSAMTAVMIAGECAIVALSAFAQAHEHGVAEVGVAVDGKSVQIEFTAPGSAIMGFEHEPKTAADKKKIADAFAKFRSNVASMFVFDQTLGCKLNTVSIELGEDDHDHGDGHANGHSHDADHDHGHSEVRALVDASCSRPVEGSTLRFQVSRYFPEASTLRVQVVGNSFQTGAELKGARNSIKLSR